MNNKLLIEGKEAGIPRRERHVFLTDLHHGPVFREFDGRFMSEIAIRNVNLFSQNDVDDLIQILTVLKHCFPRPVSAFTHFTNDH